MNTTITPDVSDIFNIKDMTTAPLQAVKSVTLSAPVANVFACVAHPRKMPEFVPGMVGVQMDEDQEARRYCDFGNDMLLEEEIIIWRPPFMVGYTAVPNNPFGLHDHFGLIICQPEANDTRTTLTWYQYFHHDDLEAIQAMIGQMLDGLFQNLINHFGGGAPPTKRSEISD